MTQEKARDFFSAYLEGTLEPAIRLGFEQRLASDAVLREEFTRFESTVSQLSALRDEPIEVPFDLNERISARLDRHIWEQKQAAPSSIFVRLRMFTFGGIAVIALVGAAITLRHSNSGSVPAGFIPTPVSEQIAVIVKNDAVMVEYAPANKSTVIFRAEPGDKPFAEMTVDRNSPLNRKVENANPATELINIQVSDSPQVEHVVLAIPGTRTEKVKSGSGTLEDFAKALAGRYRIPVKLSGIDTLTQVSWEFDASDALQAAESALKGHFSVDQRDGNLVTISQS